MIFFLLLFLIIPISPSGFAEVVFTPHQQRPYVPGDFVTGTLRFDKKVEGEIIQLKGKKFLENFFVFDLETSDGGQANITMIPLSYIDTQKTLTWAGESVDLSALRLGQSTIQPKSFIILEQSFSLPFFERFWPWLMLLFILTVAGAIVWKIRKNKISLKLLLLGKEKKIALWREEINKAAKRDDFEMIYNQRKEWSPLLEIDYEKIRDFFETLNKHQYKKEWNDAEFKEVYESYLRFKNGI